MLAIVKNGLAHDRLFLHHLFIKRLFPFTNYDYLSLTVQIELELNGEHFLIPLIYSIIIFDGLFTLNTFQLIVYSLQLIQKYSF